MFQVWVLYLSEGPFRSPTVQQKDVFNWTATYRRDSDIPTPYYWWVYYDERVKQNDKLDHNHAANKTKKAGCSVALLLLIVRYRNVLRSPVCNAAWHPRHNILLSSSLILHRACCYIYFNQNQLMHFF
jgi:hypothetical protein